LEQSFSIGGSSINNSIWTGVACLKADPRVKKFRRFGKGKGAFVNVVAWAESQDAFVQKVNRHAEELDCILVELDDVQPLESRINLPDHPDELITNGGYLPPSAE